MTPLPPVRYHLSRTFFPRWPHFHDHLFDVLRAALREFASSTAGEPAQYLTVGPDDFLEGHLTVRLSNLPLARAEVFDRPGQWVDNVMVPQNALADTMVVAASLTYHLDRPAAPEGWPVVMDADPDNPPKVWLDLRPEPSPPGLGRRVHRARCAVEWP